MLVRRGHRGAPELVGCASRARPGRVHQRRRRSANSTTAADGASSHWTSSIAIDDLAVCCQLSQQRAEGRAKQPLRRRSRGLGAKKGDVDGPRLRGGQARKNAGRYRREQVRKAREGELRLHLRRSAARTRPPRSRARRTDSSQTVVLPMPGSPTIASTADPGPRAPRNSSTTAISASRPTTAGMPFSLCRERACGYVCESPRSAAASRDRGPRPSLEATPASGAREGARRWVRTSCERSSCRRLSLSYSGPTSTCQTPSPCRWRLQQQRRT